MIVYHQRYATALPDVPTDPLRAERILAFLAAEGWVSRRHVSSPRPARMKSLARVHDTAYLETVHDAAVLGRIFGTTIATDQIDRLLDHQRLTTGGTKMATRWALDHGGLAVNLAGGQHHARADLGHGFCVFNDIAVGIAHARARGFDGRVLVVDLDLHDGDGTRAIFAQDERVHTFSIHASHWGETEAVASTAVALGAGVDDATYLDAIEQHLPPVFARFDPDLVYYLAGTDPAADDRLGDWQISSGGMLARDRRVLALARGRARVPLVVTLAGGYGTGAWRHSARFLSLALHGRAIEPPSTEAMTLERFRHLARLVDPADLSGGSDRPFGLSDDDLVLPQWGMVRETRLLGYYTKHGLELVLERSGLLGRLRDLGFSHPTLELDTSHPSTHGIRIWDSPERTALLAEARLSHDRRTVPGLTFLAIEWLQLQNPRAAFGDTSRRLPGQDHPGLGMAHEAVALCAVAAERLHLDGVIWTPAHFHTAGPWQDIAVSTEATAGQVLAALAPLLRDVPLEIASRAVEDGEVVDRATGRAVAWRPAPMVLPLSERARTWAEARRQDAAALPLPDLAWPGREAVTPPEAGRA